MRGRLKSTPLLVRQPPRKAVLFRTGRNMQLNIKASADTVRRFIAISPTPTSGHPG
jgi:hypothetical protein